MGYVGPGRWAYDEVLLPVTAWLALNDTARDAQIKAAVQRGINDAAAAGITIKDWNHIKVARQVVPVGNQPLAYAIHCEATVPNLP